jgi:hypothetical protein
MISVRKLLTPRFLRSSRPAERPASEALHGGEVETDLPQAPRRPAPNSQSRGKSLFSRAVTALFSGIRRNPGRGGPAPAAPTSADPSEERAFVLRDGREIELQAALEAKTRIVRAWRGNRRQIEARFEVADAQSTPSPKFVKTHYPGSAVAPQESEQGVGRTPQGNEIALRGMTNHHYRSDAAARAEGLPRTLSHFSHIPTEGAMTGSSNTVTVGPRDFIHRAPKQGSAWFAGLAKESRNESAEPSDYADLESFVPAIYVEENVGIARNAGVSLPGFLREGKALPLNAFRNASRDLDALNARGISYQDLHIRNLTVPYIDSNPTVRFVDCDMMPWLEDGDRCPDAGKFVRCVFEAMSPRAATDKDVGKFVKKFVKRHINRDFRKEVSRFLLRTDEAKIEHPTQELFAWN